MYIYDFCGKFKEMKAPSFFDACCDVCTYVFGSKKRELKLCLSAALNT